MSEKIMITPAILKLRSEGTYGDNVIIEIPKGVEIEILESNGTWWKVKYELKEGYVHHSYFMEFSGGIVGDVGENRLSKIANQLFNIKPNEQIVNSLIGEIKIPHMTDKQKERLKNLKLSDIAKIITKNTNSESIKDGKVIPLHNVTLKTHDDK